MRLLLPTPSQVGSEEPWIRDAVGRLRAEAQNTDNARPLFLVCCCFAAPGGGSAACRGARWGPAMDAFSPNPFRGEPGTPHASMGFFKVYFAGAQVRAWPPLRCGHTRVLCEPSRAL